VGDGPSQPVSGSEFPGAGAAWFDPSATHHATGSFQSSTQRYEGSAVTTQSRSRFTVYSCMKFGIHVLRVAETEKLQIIKAMQQVCL